ncbi:hypothetical protein MMC26_000856 [Xylographa opegraphella]|nr:hypothetical protein [Xylographa opegraphella]
MVPRAYHYATPLPVRSPTQDEKRGTVEGRRVKTEGTKKTQVSRPTIPVKMAAAPPPPVTASRPVIIPTRSQSPRLRSRRESGIVVREERDDNGPLHDMDAVSPSMAALLAMTSMPESKSLASRRLKSGRSRRVSDLQSLEGTRKDQTRPPLSSSSPQSWELLQSPPQDSDTDNWSIGSDSTVAPLSSFRSLSSESMPSLDIDLESPQSASQVSTPGKRVGRRDRRGKSLSESLVEDCGLDHPLLPSHQGPRSYNASHAQANDMELVAPNVSMPVTPSRFSFKSNLTASLRVLKSAAQSFSNMAVQRDEFLTRSILSLSPQYTDERRPILSDDIPDPALRRYLNPITASPSELHFHLNHRPGQRLEERISASIQLQTYQRPVTPSKNATSPPIFMPSSKDAFANDALVEAHSSSRQREPRENSDFLRVIVLEMNMRKAGKLNEAATGRARIWLPPRQIGRQQDLGGKGVPRRWVGVVE